MSDPISLALYVILFASTLGIVVGFERLMKGDNR